MKYGMTRRDIIIFFRQFAAMTNAGITLYDSLVSLTEQCESYTLKMLIGRIADRVKKGMTLSDSFKAEERYFDSTVCPLLRAGDASGAMGEVLERIADFAEEKAKMRAKIISAVTYPSVVAVIALVMLGVMTVVVIPQFEKAFRGLALPEITMRVFAVGLWMRKSWTIVVGLCCVFLFLLWYAARMPEMKRYTDSLLLRLPIFGGIIYKSAVARAFKTLAVLSDANVPIIRSVHMSGDASGNLVICQKFRHIEADVRKGISINDSAKDLFPPMIVQMLRIGEKTGNIPQMCSKIAEWYTGELEETVKRLSSLIEPFMLIFVGLIVALLVFAVFMPVISVTNMYL